MKTIQFQTLIDGMTNEQLRMLRAQIDNTLTERKATRGRRVLRVSYRPTPKTSYEHWLEGKIGTNIPAY